MLASKWQDLASCLSPKGTSAGAVRHSSSGERCREGRGHGQMCFSRNIVGDNGGWVGLPTLFPLLEFSSTQGVEGPEIILLSSCCSLPAWCFWLPIALCWHAIAGGRGVGRGRRKRGGGNPLLACCCRLLTCCLPASGLLLSALLLCCCRAALVFCPGAGWLMS